jgi:hypothetical protein
MTKICICFFGVISRSLPFTIESIQKNIFAELSQSNINFEIYVHNMKVDTFISKLNDCCDKLNNYCDLLKPNFFSETNQKVFDKEYAEVIQKSMKYGIVRSYNQNTVENCMRQLYSVRQVTNMWKKSGNTYDYYIYLRPDLMYINKLDVKQILNHIKSNNTLLTPHWQKHGGLNDRIYMGTGKVISLFGCRFDELIRMMEKRKRPYNPEHYMKYIADKYNIKTINSSLKGVRVRTNGQRVTEKFNI